MPANPSTPLTDCPQRPVCSRPCIGIALAEGTEPTASRTDTICVFLVEFVGRGPVHVYCLIYQQTDFNVVRLHTG